MKEVSSDLAYDYIRSRILSGEYPDGKTLITSLLAKEIGISRTPVRDALRQLETDGLVVIRAHFGASVKSVDFKEFTETCAVRQALESFAAGLAAQNRTEVELEEIAAALQGMRRATEQILASGQERGLVDELMREDIRFHLAILTAAKNDVLKKEILRLHLINRIVTAQDKDHRTFSDREESSSNRREVLQEHVAIHRAIAKGNRAEAASAMNAHLQTIIDKQVRLRREKKPSAAKPPSEEELIYTT